MKKTMHCLFGICIATALLATANAKTTTVRTLSQLNAAMNNANPGDSVVIANGTYSNWQMNIKGDGNASNRIKIRAQSAGQVIFTGQSSLDISGSYLNVSGFTFKNGYAPSGSRVIAINNDNGRTTKHVRVFNMVVDGFNHPNRDTNEVYLRIRGENNMIDKSSFLNKTNRGSFIYMPTTGNTPRNNIIQDNYLAFRPENSHHTNGLEALRLGTGAPTSLNAHNTIVRRNFFESCTGEGELMSIKSSSNIIEDNYVYNCQGSIVLRDGNNNTVRRNMLIGYGNRKSGGIRVIGKNQHVYENYVEGARAAGITSALTVMSGFSGSSPTYRPVEGSVVEQNTFVNCVQASNLGLVVNNAPVAPKYIYRYNLLGFTQSSLATNRFIEITSNDSGIVSERNVSMNASSNNFSEGISRVNHPYRYHSNGLLYPEANRWYVNRGAPLDLAPLSKGSVGATYFTKPITPQTPFRNQRSAIPGNVEAEHFDQGGQSSGYNDTDSSNKGGGVFRTGEGVDVGRNSSATFVGWTSDGEWLEYSVDVATERLYKFRARIASTRLGRVTISVDGDHLFTRDVPVTGSWTNYQSKFLKNAVLPAGKHVIRIKIDKSGFNLDRLEITPAN